VKNPPLAFLKRFGNAKTFKAPKLNDKERVMGDRQKRQKKSLEDPF
jgi:hypothetical protein